jgi:hypothetical protein
MPHIPPAPPQQIAIAKQILYPATLIDVITQPDGNVILQITVPGCAEQMMFPMGADAAREIGHKLAAPHIVPAHSNGHGPTR